MLMISPEECFGDTPHFREKLEASEKSMLGLEAAIKAITKITLQVSDSAKEHSDKNSRFADELINVAKCSSPAGDFVPGVSRFTEVMKEIEKSRHILLTNMKDVFLDPMDKFLRCELSECKKTGALFAEAENRYENSLQKYMNKKSKDSGITEAAEEAAAMHKEFHRKSIRYVIALNNFHNQKQFEVIETIVAFLYTQFAFFHQGYELLKDLEPIMRELSSTLSNLRAGQTKNPTAPDEDFILQKIRPELYNPASPTPSLPKKLNPTDSFKKVGFLFKKSSPKVRNLWQKRYFELEGNMLSYFSIKSKEDADSWTQIDLRVCMTRESKETDRRFCFEVVSPNRTYLLQAENEYAMCDWMSSITRAIHSAINSTRPSPSILSSSLLSSSADNLNLRASQADEDDPQKSHILETLQKAPGNGMCADCAASEPDWVSTNLGIILCIACSGIHRGLGRNISKIRSATLDRWEPELLTAMSYLGNTVGNSIFEASLKGHAQAASVRPGPKANRVDKERWITAKYMTRDFVWDETNTKEVVEMSVDAALFNSVDASNLPQTLKYLALGGNINWKRKGGEYTPLIQAVINNHIGCTEFLLQWMCDVNLQDASGATALHHAVTKNNASIVSMLLRRQAICNIKDNKGRIPLDIAVEQSSNDESYAKIVTLLRLSVFNNDNNNTMKWRASAFGIDEAMHTLAFSKSDTPAAIPPPPVIIEDQFVLSGSESFPSSKTSSNFTPPAPAPSSFEDLDNPWGE